MDGKLTQEEALRLLRARTLSVWEDAALLREYIRLCGITQSECAVRLGRSQSSVANRLRLLRLTDGERRAMQEAGFRSATPERCSVLGTLHSVRRRCGSFCSSA